MGRVFYLLSIHLYNKCRRFRKPGRWFRNLRGWKDESGCVFYCD